MTQDPNQPTTPTSPAHSPPPKKRRRWPKVLLVILLLLLLLVALLPTIASTPPVRSFVLGKINDQLNGRVSVDRWSLGWLSSIHASGIKVYDAEERLILDVPEVKLGVSVMDLLQQDFAMGDDNRIEVASFLVAVDENHQTSIDRLTKKRDQPQTADSGPTRLPDISGTFTVNIQQGTIESVEKKWPAVHVRESQATATITDISSPIQNMLKLVYQIGEGQQSVLQTSGSIAAVKDNVLDLTQLAADQKVSFSNVNLAAAAPFVPDVPNLSGIVNGEMDLKAQGLAGLSTAGELKITDVSAGPYQTPQMTIPVQITRSAMAGGDSLIKFEKVGIQAREGTIALTGQVPESALRNIIDGKAPGAAGSISLVASVTDLGQLASQFKDTIKLQEGVSVTSGTGREELSVTITPSQLQIVQNLRFEAKGTRGQQDIEIKPITVAASAVAIPTGQLMPDIRNLRLNVTSTFATLTGGGESLAKLAINGKVGLDALSTELRQFVDMQKMQLQGGGEFSINTDGDLTSTSAPILVKSTGTFQNVKIIGVFDQPVDQDRLTYLASGEVVRKGGKPVGVQKGYVELVGGEASAPLLDVQANYTVDLDKQSLTWFELTKCTVTSLQKLQQQYGGLVPALASQGLTIDSGAFYATAAGSYVDDVLIFSRPASVSITNLTLKQANQTLLSREVIRASANGSLSVNDGITGQLTDLSVTTQSNLITVSKGGQGPLSFAMTRKGDQSVMRGNGAVTLAADLKRVNDLALAFGGAAVASSDQPRVTGGALNGTLTLAKADQPQTNLNFDGRITGLTVSNASGPIAQNEQLTINLSAVAPDDLSARPLTAEAKISGSFLNATVSDAQIAMGAALLDIIRSAAIDVQISDLAKTHALAMAATGGGGPTTGPAAAPLLVTAGNATVRASIRRDTSSQTTQVTVTDARINQLALKRGNRPYAFTAPIAAKLNASIKGTAEAETIQVRELSAESELVSLSMPEPLTITRPTGDRPVYQGAIAAKGQIQKLTPLIAMLQDAEPMPYQGEYDLSQKLSTRQSDGVIVLAGAVNVSNFQVMSGNRPAFSEPRMAIRNNLSIDPNGKKIHSDELTLTMPQSQALALNFTGGVNFWDTTRTIRDNTKLDLTYDLEKIWPIVYPMLSPEQQATYKDLKIAGKYQKSFALSGAFPVVSDGSTTTSFASLNADGSFAIDLLDTMGLNIQKLAPTIKMTRGVVRITGAPAQLNEGTLDASDIVIDLSRPAPALTIARNKRLVRDAKINPVLANSLGKFASVIFAEASQASGLLDVTVLECQNVPIGALMTQGNEARAKIVYSIRNIQVDGIVPKAMSDVLALGTPGLVGEVPESTVTLADGQVASDLTFAIRRTGRDQLGQEVISQLPLKFNGSVGMKTLQLRDFEAVIPKDLLPDRIGSVNLADVRRALPPQIRVPITGTLSRIQIDPVKAVVSNLPGLNLLQPGSGGNQDPLQNLGGILEQLQGGRRNEQPPAGAREPAPQEPAPREPPPRQPDAPFTPRQAPARGRGQ